MHVSRRSPELDSSLTEAYTENKDAMYEAWGIPSELGDFYDRAMTGRSNA